LLALATGLAFGLYPAFLATRIDLRSGLAESGRNATAHRRNWTREILVVAEVTLGVTLVVAAGLLLRTLSGLMNLNPGFVPQNVTTASVVLNDARYQTTASGVRFFRDTLGRIRQIPGVESAAATLNLPFAAQLNDGIGRILASNGEVTPQNGMVNVNYATPGLFTTLRVAILQGRGFTDADGPHARKVIVVDDAFVRHFLPNDPHPLGDQVQSGSEFFTIIGIVKSVPQVNGWGGSYGPLDYFAELYFPVAQWNDSSFQLANTWFSPSFVVRTHGHIAGLRHAMEQAVARVDPRLPFSQFQNIDDVLAAALSQQRYMAVLFSTLAALALLLAAIGIYGLIAQSVAQRTREMGIRLALGATATNIVRQTAAPGIVLAIVGVICGLVLSWFATRLLTSLIYGVSATDPITFIAVAVLLIVVAIFASLLPALRLTCLDPAQTLREE
jgi:predicted permease